MKKGKNLLMVNVSGQDQPGITATLVRVLVEHNVEVVDIEQASLQNLLGLYLLLDLSKASDSKDSVIKDLLFEASKLNLTLNFRFFSPNEVLALNQRNLYVLTHFGGTHALAELSRILGEEKVNIEMISSLAHHDALSVEMILNVNSASSLSRLKQKIMVKSHELNIDLALQKMEAYRKNKRLIFFDMDSTLVDMEIIDEMALRAGVYREVSRITEKAMRGDFDFEESLIQRVALIKGLAVSELTEIRNNMRLSQGVEELTTTLRWLGYKLGVITGGFDFFSDYLKEKLGFDFAFANKLEIKNGVLTGRIVGPIIDAAQKARIVNQTSCDQGILLDQTVVVGDGANDALMLGQAGLGIAYNAKKGVDRAANVSLGRSRLKNILYLLGVTEEDIKEALTVKSG
ncbi:MAG: phosphoserine phosphatase SerB [Desulfobacterales bacterium]|nr:phosphoserine phosphatase SerB [Pseudomonadota bacterium]MCG2775056.1 phosphoserine phosphatase SerB [Desulfobacterales bacterium]